MHRKTIFMLFMAILLGACAGEPAEPLPTPLPTAVPPDNPNAIGDWAISFKYEFPEAFWPEGSHRYAFAVQCPPELTDINYNGQWNNFEVSETAGYSPEPVYLRINGLSLAPFTPIYVPDAYFNPQQDTTAIIHFLGLTKEAADRAGDECEALVAWDEFPPQPLIPLEPFQP